MKNEDRVCDRVDRLREIVIGVHSDIKGDIRGIEARLATISALLAVMFVMSAVALVWSLL